MGWLLDGEEIVSASDFVNLSGEGEMFEELNIEEIVELVPTKGQHKPDSDEDEHDEPHIVPDKHWTGERVCMEDSRVRRVSS
jgi:hypothetical protein